MQDQKWEYKGHQCEIEMDIEPEENIKAWHTVVTPEGEKKYPDISPYDARSRSVELWIDLGYPGRIPLPHGGTANWRFDDLKSAMEKEGQVTVKEHFNWNPFAPVDCIGGIVYIGKWYECTVIEKTIVKRFSIKKNNLHKYRIFAERKIEG